MNDTDAGSAKRNPVLHLEVSRIDAILDLVSGFALLVEQMRQSAVHETMAAQEFMEWLKYGMSSDIPTDRTGTQLLSLTLIRHRSSRGGGINSRTAPLCHS